jgi:hypothetical protein
METSDFADRYRAPLLLPIDRIPRVVAGLPLPNLPAHGNRRVAGHRSELPRLTSHVSGCKS